MLAPRYDHAWLLSYDAPFIMIVVGFLAHFWLWFTSWSMNCYSTCSPWAFIRAYDTVWTRMLRAFRAPMYTRMDTFFTVSASLLILAYQLPPTKLLLGCPALCAVHKSSPVVGFKPTHNHACTIAVRCGPENLLQYCFVITSNTQ